MSLPDRLNNLWAGSIDSISVDLLRQRVELAIHTVDGGAIARYRLSFSGVFDIHLVNTHIGDGDWNYAELSEITCTFQADESVVTEISMWLDTSRLTIRSLRIDLEDVAEA